MRLFYSLLLSFMTFSATAQMSNLHVYGSFFDLNAARYNPARLGEGDASLEILIPPFINGGAWVSNNMLNGKQIYDFFRDENVAAQDAIVNEFIGDLDRLNAFRFGATITPLALAKKFYKQVQYAGDSVTYKEEVITVSLEVASRAEGSLFLSNEVAQVLWNGAATYANQNINLDRFTVNAFAHNEIVLGIAKPFQLNRFMNLRMGLRLKYLMGMAAANTENASFSMQSTDTEATFTGNYLAHKALDDDGDNVEFDPLRPLGKGFGVDFSAALSINDRLVTSLGFLDVGSINYNKNVSNYRKQGSVTLSGSDIDFLNGTTEDYENQLDAIGEAFKPEETNNSFRMPLPSRMFWQMEYRVPASVSKSNQRRSKQIDYYLHRFFFTYNQGFRNSGIATTRAQATLAYSYNLRQKLNLGTSMSFGGFQPFALGAFISARLGFFRLGVGSNNLNYFISRRNSYGGDLSFTMSMAFR